MANLATEAERIAQSYHPPETGAPSRYLSDPDTLKELLAQLAAGQRRPVACALAGITEQTFYNWQKKADAGEEPHKSLFVQVKRAEAFAEQKVVQHVLSAAEKPQFWAAGMTYLERKYPDQWGRRSEDSSGPKVVVQIGVKDSEVTVSLTPPTFACSTQPLSLCETGLTGDIGSDK